MAVIVEDGTGKTDSNSYVAIGFADSYFSTHGEKKWAELPEDEKEVLLINATDFIDNVFRWKGIKGSYEQALQFPRKKLIDNNGYTVEGIPVQLQQAVCEASLISSTGKKLFSVAESKGDIISEDIGGQLKFTYDNSTKVKDKTIYESINSRLRGLIIDSSKNQVVTGSYIRV